MAFRIQAGKVALFVCCLLSLKGNAQKLKTDTIPVHSPRKAAILSAVLPGAGQFYNRKYWKIGVVYAGAAALVYSLQFNNRYYHLYKNELILREQNSGIPNPDLQRYTNSNLSELQSYYRRNRDLTVIGFALLYTLNILDATVDAHLFDFNLNESLSVRIRPEFQPIPAMGAHSAGFCLNFHF